MHESNVLCHDPSNLLSNLAEMKSIGVIRQLRLQQFVTQTGLSYADINSDLGRDRRDATLNQIVKGAKNTSTGKPRRMGDTQARLLETTFRLPDGWFDSDPDEHPDLLARKPTGELIVKKLPKSLFIGVREDVASYRASQPWPFQTVPREEVAALSSADRATLERVILAFMGKPTAMADWRPVALKLAAELDKGLPEPNFTLFVRAVETELAKLSPQVKQELKNEDSRTE